MSEEVLSIWFFLRVKNLSEVGSSHIRTAAMPGNTTEMRSYVGWQFGYFQ
jgi:hypothetical protein